jgi:hypothetical protein
LGQLATNVVAEAEISKRNAVHVFGCHNGGIEAVKHNVLGGRKATRTLVAVVTIAPTGTLVAVTAKTIGARPITVRAVTVRAVIAGTVLTVRVSRSVGTGSIRTGSIRARPVVTTKARGASLVTSSLITTSLIAFGTSSGTAVIARTVRTCTVIAPTDRTLGAVTSPIVARFAVVGGSAVIGTVAGGTVVTVAAGAAVTKFGGATFGTGATGCTCVALGTAGARSASVVVAGHARWALVPVKARGTAFVARTCVTAGLGCATCGSTGRRSAARGRLRTSRASAKARTRTFGRIS